jgi:hypothetical protein
MLATDGVSLACRVYNDGLVLRWATNIPDCPLHSVDGNEDFLPDLSDPATLGCLLALVREAWGDPLMQAMNAGGGWVGFRPAPIWTDKEGCYDTEAEALVAALEAAP